MFNSLSQITLEKKTALKHTRKHYVHTHIFSRTHTHAAGHMHTQIHDQTEQTQIHKHFQIGKKNIYKQLCQCSSLYINSSITKSTPMLSEGA